MREREFRAKEVNGDWVYGDLVHTKHFTYILDISFVPAKSLPAERFIEVLPETVGQFTGLQDKNGVKIYEGDVDENGDVVMWCDNRCGWSLNVYDFKSKKRIFCHCLECEGNFEINDVSFEIIGNIHDK